jgi:hypothetical protein
MVESAKLEVIKYENHNNSNYDFQVDNNVNIDPYTMFLHAMKSPVTKAKYSRRLELFFDFLKIPGETIEEQCLTFINNGRSNVNWGFTNILKFVLFHKERIHKKEISGATLINYLKAIKLFCEMSDLSINWKKITRGLSKGKRYANDRIPTLEEVRKIVIPKVISGAIILIGYIIGRVVGWAIKKVLEKMNFEKTIHANYLYYNLMKLGY